MLRNIGKKFTLLIVMLTVMLSTMVGVFAEDAFIVVPPADKTEFKRVWDNLNPAGQSKNKLTMDSNKKSDTNTTYQLLKYDETSGKITFKVDDFKESTEKSRKAAMANFVKNLQNSDVSQQTQQNIFENMQEADPDVKALVIPMVMDSTNADLFTALKILSPFLPIVRVLLGIGAIIIVLLLFLSTVVDLAYIGLPMAREAGNNAKDGQGGGGKLPFVSADAMSVVKETESSLDSGGKYKNAYVIYFKRRSFTYIILSICILYLVVGEIGGLISWLLSLGSGVVN